MAQGVNYSEYIEREPHGTDEFPIEFYRLDAAHHRYEMNLHWHPEAELIRVHEGSFELHLNQRTYLLCAGDAAVINPGTLHRGIPHDCRYECAVFKTEMLCPPGASVGRYVKPLATQSSAVREFYSSPAAKEDAAAVEAIDRLFSVLGERRERYELDVYAALYHLFSVLYGIGAVARTEAAGTSARQEQLTRLLSWIDENYTHPITLTSLSKVSGFSEKYLCRFFREQTSYTPIDYVNRLRVEKAADDMLHRHLSATEAAFANGFNDSAYFSKVFRRIKGTSPREFRRMHDEGRT